MATNETLKEIGRGNSIYRLVAINKVPTHVVKTDCRTPPDTIDNDAVVIPVDILRELLKDSY